jgi:flagellar protein FlaF
MSHSSFVSDLPADQGSEAGDEGRAAPRRYGEATRAYAASAAHRSVRDQESDVFRRTNRVLRRARQQGGVAMVKALADDQRLWMATIDLLYDPDNALPADLRASLISVGHVVLRELRADQPDLEFLLAINENIAAGLSERG